MGYAGVHSDQVNYTFIAADCGDQPRTEGEHYPGAGDSQRSAFEGAFRDLRRCEWSITAGYHTTYNCIAWSVDETNSWYNSSYIAHNYGDKDDVFEIEDMDDFYLKKKIGPRLH